MADLNPTLVMRASTTDRIEICDRLDEALDEAASLIRVLAEHQRAGSPLSSEVVIPSYDQAARRVEDAKRLAHALYDAR